MKRILNQQDIDNGLKKFVDLRKVMNLRIILIICIFKIYIYIYMVNKYKFPIDYKLSGGSSSNYTI